MSIVEATGVVMMLGDVLNAEKALARIADQPLRAKTAYRVSRLLSRLREEVHAFESLRSAKVKTMGIEREPNEEEREKGWTTVNEIPQERMGEFRAELEETLGTRIEFDKWLLTVEMFDGAQLRPDDILALGPLMDE